MGMIEIKGHILGAGKPLVCVPIMKGAEQEILTETARLVAAGIPVLEWRMDAFEDVSGSSVEMMLAKMKPLLGETILIATFRSKAQGGLRQLPEEEMKKIRRRAAESGAADFIDIEYFGTGKAEREIKAVHKRGARVILSHHDFDKTPSSDVMRQYLEEMKDAGADVVKLAVMPENMEDVLMLLGETLYFHRIYSCPVITMAMGQVGSISRVAGEYFGSCLTFGSAGEASAPGQLPVEELDRVLEILHRSGA